MATPLFSIIIPTKNEEYRIKKLLASIADQSLTDYEVIVSDSGSDDDTKKVAESFRNTVTSLIFREDNMKNVSAARNNGAQYASGKWLLFVDADVVLSHHFLKHTARHILIDRPDMMTVWNMPIEKNSAALFIFFLMNCAMSFFARIKPGMNGPCMIIRKDIFEKVKGFDDTIFFGEDFEITQRAAKQGAQLNVYRNPKIFISARRIEVEGALPFILKSLKALIYQLFIGPVRKPLFPYEMGGQHYRSGTFVPKSQSEPAVKKQTSAGGIVYKRKSGVVINGKRTEPPVEWLVTQHSQHKGWVFPKGLVGDVHQSEHLEDAALREVNEEGGVRAHIVHPVPVKVMYTYTWEKVTVEKTVYYYLMEYDSGDPKDHDWEMSDAQFVTEKEVKRILTYPSDQSAFDQIVQKYNDINLRV